MGGRVKGFIKIEDENRGELSEAADGARGDAGAAYRRARAHVLEASLRGLVCLRVVA